MGQPTPIAVVGVAFRLPGANNIESLESLLNTGRSGFGPVPKTRWNSEAFTGAQSNGKDSVGSKGGYFLQDDIAKFDARFFQIARQEASTMDPKQRLLLQTTYEALENAGQPLEDLRGSNTSVYISTFTYDYERMGYRDMQQLPGSHITGTGPALLSNRISYAFDLKGPSFTLDTGCSGGLVALHQACQSLRLGESDMAIVGGAQLLIDPSQSANMSTIGMLNVDGHCFAFDSRGSGYGRGEGIASFVLKPLDRALIDGDPVHTVIVNSGINQDGKSAGSIMSPSGEAQRDLMRSVYAEIGLSPADTPYVEAHGTGTKVGDKEEVSSIYQVFCENQQRRDDLIVGSVKANIGHLEASAGLAGLLKAIVVLNTGLVPPQLNFVESKPTLHLEERKIKIASSLTELPSGPRRVSVNSFGYGGTNCHVIVESLESYAGNNASSCCPVTSSHSNGDQYIVNSQHHVTPQLFVLSANSETSLRESTESLSTWITERRPPPEELSDLAHTLFTRRSLHAWRKSIVASSTEELVQGLNEAIAKKAAPATRLVFVFTGQGAQWPGMGRELMEYAAFEASILESEKLLLSFGCDWLLSEELMAPEDISRLGKAELAQPSTTALQIALVDFLATLGIQPSTVVGHSSGEIGAAYAAGALTHSAAIEAAYRRGVYSGQAKQRNPTPGCMLAAGLGEEGIKKYLSLVNSAEHKVVVACVNSPQSTTISGDVTAIDQLKTALDADGVFARKLKVDTAYHSHHMQTIAEDYRASLAKVPSQAPRSEVIFNSTVSGIPKKEGFTSDYWVENLVSPVRFVDAIRLVGGNTNEEQSDESLVFVELGPTAALAGPAKQTLSGVKHTYLSALSRKVDGRKSLLILLGRLYELGHTYIRRNLQTTHKKPKTLSNLPGYPFDTAEYWYESRISKAYRFRKHPLHDLCGLLDPASTLQEPRWRHFLHLDALPWLKDHVVDNNAVLPASGYVAMVIEASKQWNELKQTPGTAKTYVLKDVTLSQAISFPLDDVDSNIEIQLTISRSKAGLRWDEFEILSHDKQADTWYENCRGLISVEYISEHDEVEANREADLEVEAQLAMLKSIQGDSPVPLSRNAFYEELKATGNYYGDTFALLGDVNRSKDHGWTTLAVPDFQELMPNHCMQPHIVHPTILDSFTHIAAMLAKGPCSDASIVVGSIREMRISANFAQESGSELVVSNVQQVQDIRTTHFQVLAFHKRAEGDLVPIFSGSYVNRAFSSTKASPEVGPFVQKKAYNVAYRPDVTFLPKTALRDNFGSSDNSTTQSESGEQSLDDDCRDAAAWLGLLAFKSPFMKILQMGDVLPRMTQRLLETLFKHGGGLWSDRFDIAPKSDGEVKVLEPWKDLINFRSLQLDAHSRMPPEETEIKYDLIVLPATWNTTLNPETVIQNIRSLLLPGGKVLFLEGGNESDSAVPAFELWQDVLQRHPFCVAAHGASARSLNTAQPSFLVAEIEDTRKQSPASVGTIVNAYSCGSSDLVAQYLQAASLSTGGQFNLASNSDLAQFDAASSALCIVLDTAEHALLLNDDSPAFEHLKTLLTGNSPVLWVGLRDTQSIVSTSKKSMMIGTSRVVRRENGGTVPLVVVDIEDSITSDNVSDISQKLISIGEAMLAQTSGSYKQAEFEYLYKDSKLLIPRLELDNDFLRNVGATGNHPSELITTPYHQQGRALKLEVGIPGLLGSLRFADDVLTDELKPCEIELESRAHGINFKDVFIALGQMPPTVNMVGEVSGVVTAVGSEMQGRYHIGEAVMGFFAKPFTSKPRINGNLAHAVPTGMDFHASATIPCIYATAYHCLFEVARLRKGQTILITAASGGVGQAAIQLAQQAGVTDVFVLVGSKAKKQLIMDEYSIPESHVFSSRKLDFKAGILRLTEGRGVDVVLNSLTGDMLIDAFDCVAKLGTFCEIGKGDIYKGAHLNLNPFDRSITFAAVDLVAVSEHRPELVHDHLHSITKLFEEGKLRPLTPITTYPIGHIEDAFRLISGRKHTGKVVLVSDTDATVKALPAKPAPLVLATDGAYLIVGGLGDLGRRLATLLAAHGAGNIILLSRRDPSEEIKSELHSITTTHGTRIHHVKCDVSIDTDVRGCADYCSAKGLTVRGVIHSGMVLRDRPFANMTRDEFSAPLGPKVYGTINLDKVFASESLDFFVMLSSSATTIGNGSQANYTAANAFLDGFAKAHADNPHTRYVSLSLGAVEGSGAIAATSDAQSNRLKSISVTMEEVMKAVEYAMSPAARDNKLSHAVLGISWQSLTDAEDTVSLAHPIFSRLALHGTEAVKKGAGDLKQQIQNASTLQEAETLILQALHAKCASFLDRPVEDVSLNQPLSNIGFDSLVSIELKNWIIRTFECTIQTAEISGAASITALSSKITSRSKLVSDETKSKMAGTAVEATQSAEEEVIGSLEKFECCPSATRQRVPLLSLDDYLEVYTASVWAFARSDEEREAVRRAVEDFRKPGGLGRELYAVLERRAADPDNECWYVDPEVKGVTAHFRHSLVPWHVFVDTHHDSEVPHTQAERAALVAATAFSFLRGMEKNEMVNDWLGSRALCSHYWKWMFNSVREPRVWCDQMKLYPASRYVAVLRNGHLFKVALTNEPHEQLLLKLKAVFTDILERQLGEDCWVSILTTDFRDKWASNREMLMSISPENTRYFQTIEEATFVINLDSDSPHTHEERVSSAFAGTGFNKWFDKTMQFVVTANGRSAQVTDHTVIDGLTPMRLTEFIHDAIQSYKPGNQTKPTGESLSMEPLSLQTTPEIDSHLDRLRRRYAKCTAAKGYRYIKTDKINHRMAANTGLSSKTCLDMAIHLAQRLLVGHNPVSWEPIDNSHFHCGRPDPRQSTTDYVIAFCDAALNDSSTLADRKRLMVLAQEEADAQVTRAQSASGFLRRTESLIGVLALRSRDNYVPLDLSDEEIEQWSWPKSIATFVSNPEDLPELFTASAFTAAFPGCFMIRNEGEFVDAATYIMGEGGLYVSNRMRGDFAALSVTGDADKMDEFVSCFEKAADIVREIVLAS